MSRIMTLPSHFFIRFVGVIHSLSALRFSHETRTSGVARSGPIKRIEVESGDKVRWSLTDRFD